MNTSCNSQIQTGVAIDQGKVRTQQQDALFVDVPRGLMIVADGMGGHRGGDVASQMVTRLLPDLLEPVLQEPDAGEKTLCRRLIECIYQLSRHIHDIGRQQPELRGLGATVVMVWVNGPHAFIAHMGDSRAYLLRDGKLQQVTDDHSVVGLLLRNKMILPEEAETHPARHQLSRYVGMSGEGRPEARRHALREGDRLLLCSDGLTGMVKEERIGSILTGSPDPDAAARLLVSAANHAGGVDNVTVVIGDVLCLDRPACSETGEQADGGTIVDPAPPPDSPATTTDFGQGTRLN